MPELKKIIIADNDFAIKEMCKTKLSGYDIMIADDGASAVKMIKQEKPDLVLLDILIPKKDGFEILKEIKSDKDEKISSTPFFIVSNLANEQDVQEAKNLGAISYIIKAKTTSVELIEKINQFCKK